MQLIQREHRKTLAIFVILHAAIFMGYFSNLGYLCGTFGFELNIAQNMLNGQLPYHDFLSEYPPIILFTFIIPALFTSSLGVYSTLYAAMIFLVDLVGLLVMAKFASHLKMRLWHVLSAYTLFLLAMGPIVTDRYDLLPAVLVLVALYAFIRGRNKTAWALLALGAMTKIYPVIIAPFFALYLLYYRKYKELVLGCAIFSGVILAISLPWLAIDADGYWYVLGYHMERGLHAETSYASVLLVGQLLGLTQVTWEFSFGSWNLSSPLADSLSHASTYILAGCLLIVYAFYARLVWRKPYPVPVEGALGLDTKATADILRYSLLVTLILLLGSKLFSPQFLIWLCPLLPLVRGRWYYASWILFLVIGGLTQYVYPYHYIEFFQNTPYLIIMMACRNFLLLVMFILICLQIRRF